MPDSLPPRQPRTLTIGDSATVAGIAGLRAEILATLDVSDDVVLDLTDLADADFTFFQTLCAAHREAHLRGKRLTVVGRRREVASTARVAGFMRTRGTLPGCLWLEAEHG